MINNKKLGTENISIEAITTIIAGATVNDNEQSEKVSWWINELDSLGIKTSSNNNKSESKDNQELEDLTDDIKQAFIHDYKTCYMDKMQRWQK